MACRSCSKRDNCACVFYDLELAPLTYTLIAPFAHVCDNVIIDIVYGGNLMSEYQRYEFMTCDRPLTKTQLDAVNNLSSHIEVSATRALVEYNWGSFKHNPIDVLYRYFDGFLYWANWGAPHFALRFPHGTLPVGLADLISDYDFGDFVTFTPHPDYDILDMDFGEMQGSDEWIDYELGALIAIRDELMEGDLRALYLAWLATQEMIGIEDEEEDEAEDVIGMPIPPALGTLTPAQKALMGLLQVSQELVIAAALHNSASMPSSNDDFAAWIKLLPQERREDYLLRLAQGQPGLSRLLVMELRELGQDKTATKAEAGESLSYAKLLAESRAIMAEREREQHEQELQARQRRLQTVHDHQDTYWRQVEEAVERGTSASYNEAVQLLIELRHAAELFQESQQFQAHFLSLIRPYLRRSALIQRLRVYEFTIPEAR